MVEPTSDPKTRQEDCTHHWRIGRPSGETSSAICLMCGASRRFNNYVPGSYGTRGRGRPRDAKNSK